jgi:hypothetical protein
MTAQQVASRLESIGCQATANTAVTSIQLGITPVAELNCAVNGEQVTIDQYRDAQQLAAVNALVKGFACLFAKRMGVTSFSSVQGANWTAYTMTESTVKGMHAALRAGKIVTVKCS